MKKWKYNHFRNEIYIPKKKGSVSGFWLWLFALLLLLGSLILSAHADYAFHQAVGY